jgi:hypothetical protein
MQSWLDIEQSFRSLIEPLRSVRLEVQWGTLPGEFGEYWHLVGIGSRSPIAAQFLELAACAGDALARALAENAQGPNWLSDPHAHRRWFRALRELSGAFRFYAPFPQLDQESSGSNETDEAYETHKEDQRPSAAFAGSIDDVVEVSANFCLLLQSRFPLSLASENLQAQPPVTHTYPVQRQDSHIRVLPADHLESVRSINVYLGQLQGAGKRNVTEAIKHLVEAVAVGQMPQGEDRTDALEELEELSKQAVLAPDRRVKRAVLKAVTLHLSSTFGATDGLAEVWSTWGPTVMTFFDLQAATES